ncbi:UTP--glucose-1-phosphate uridylyltransferase [Neobacillus notoginsengisoli]|uniref:UTP--glucose-1-phosphate uridylyltransferase n=1 Tax=Neobacillus notoginsengisoli TaxID=1578198 RepID=A0A417Z139_9BACI|nr:UTP--glucose-1-phosphate uridylyltransferase [Neobacillus notoginsengisoli]RHW43568.1 UTP--glucose-1-phosphate uridylyltransferase [Neobacillus notoginsengisoli]
MVKKAIIPAAGYGTRTLPITKVLPKEMLPICGRPAIDYIVQEAIQSGIEQILIVVSKSKSLILDYYDRSVELEAYLNEKNKQALLKELHLPDVHIQYVRQQYPKGLGDAILLGKHFAGKDPFAVLLPDEIILSEETQPLAQLIERFKLFKGNIIGVQTMPEADLIHYGVIDPGQPDKNGFIVKDIVEKPQQSPPSNLAVIGRYVFDPAIFTYLENIQPGAGGEIQLTDAIKAMAKEQTSYGLKVDGLRFDVARQDEYVKLINRICGPRGNE